MQGVAGEGASVRLCHRPGSALIVNKAGLVLSEVRQSTNGDGKSTDVITRRPDTIILINVLLGRIAQLEKTRSELLTATRDSGDGVDEKARVPTANEVPATWAK